MLWDTATPGSRSRRISPLPPEIISEFPNRGNSRTPSRVIAEPRAQTFFPPRGGPPPLPNRHPALAIRLRERKCVSPADCSRWGDFRKTLGKDPGAAAPIDSTIIDFGHRSTKPNPCESLQDTQGQGKHGRNRGRGPRRGPTHSQIGERLTRRHRGLKLTRARSVRLIPPKNHLLTPAAHTATIDRWGSLCHIPTTRGAHLPLAPIARG